MKTIFSFLAYILALSTLEYVAGAFDARIVCAINALRIKNKLPALVNDVKLNVAAYVHAHRLALAEAPLSHYSNNTDPGQRVDKYGFAWTALAELLSNEAFPLTYFLKNPDHLTTILSRDVDSIGVAVEQSPGNVPYVVIEFAKGLSPAKGKPPSCDNVVYDNQLRLKKLTNYTINLLLQKLTPGRKTNRNLTDLSSFRVKQFLGSLEKKSPHSETEFATKAASQGVQLGKFAKFETCASYDVTSLLEDFTSFSRLVPKSLDRVGVSVEQSNLANVICICAIFAPSATSAPPSRGGRYVPKRYRNSLRGRDRINVRRRDQSDDDDEVDEEEVEEEEVEEEVDDEEVDEEEEVKEE